MKRNRAKNLFGVPILLVLLLIASPALAQVYQWEDEEGTVQMTDDLQKVPEKYRERAREIILPKKKEGSASPDRPEDSGPFILSEKVDNQGHNREWWQERLKGWRQKRAQAEEKLAEANGRLGQIRRVNPSVAMMQEEAEVRKEIRQRQEALQ